MGAISLSQQEADQHRRARHRRQYNAMRMRMLMLDILGSKLEMLCDQPVNTSIRTLFDKIALVTNIICQHLESNISVASGRKLFFKPAFKRILDDICTYFFTYNVVHLMNFGRQMTFCVKNIPNGPPGRAAPCRFRGKPLNGQKVRISPP